MKSLAELALLALAFGAQDMPPAGDGPRATSGETQRHDDVVRAAMGERVTHPDLPVGSVIELTSLANGVTLLTRVEANAPLALPQSLIERLTTAGQPYVRVRAVTPLAAEDAALRTGQPVERLPAPTALLTGLRRRVPTSSPVLPASSAEARPLPPVSAAVAASGWIVQVAMLSNEARARELAARLNGTAQAAGNLWRVRMGPFTARADADSALDKAVASGFGDARIVRAN
ncbi:SPOR domain-containing protein [Sphingomonas sp.]